MLCVCVCDVWKRFHLRPALKESQEIAIQNATNLSKCEELRIRLQKAVADERRLRVSAEARRDADIAIGKAVADTQDALRSSSVERSRRVTTAGTTLTANATRDTHNTSLLSSSRRTAGCSTCQSNASNCWQLNLRESSARPCVSATPRRSASSQRKSTPAKKRTVKKKVAPQCV